MSIPVRPGFDLSTTYVQLFDGGAATLVPVGESFWSEIHQRTELHAGRLAMLMEMTRDPDHQEMHPAGDEILILISGSVDVVLETRDGPQIVELRDRGSCIVPRGVWHGQRVLAPSAMIFITPGAGTEHRPQPR